ncbi:hypothetical protein PPSIR1_23609 [Plesiocystis pacifica SIR-1]|uniref:Uncharacterized protein n=1 Tax=Plesiocystis pacifica SIR-1 TaxID=391625 RepID=A6G7W4_9BACT|nr:aldolase/citrate lyase family protein [Plesiocystis pacifica]EDM78057.1 hypothetical protein PPSIR1_23609 [Plesiocystis pacifica SIR-1]
MSNTETPTPSLGEAAARVLERLEPANREFTARFGGDRPDRQPVHTVYGGAQLYKAETTTKLGELALRALDQHAPDAQTFAEAVGMAGDAALAAKVYGRVRAKLEREPVEDFRIDFEDGYGTRTDAEEDREAARTAGEVVEAMGRGQLPPFIGIRIKSLTEENKARAARTLDIFVSTLVAKLGAPRLPDNFVVTVPKVSIPEQVSAVVELCELLEDHTGLARGALALELMVETTQSMVDAHGRATLPRLLDAARGRCTGAHFGTYDYTASASVTAAYQVMDHPACDMARNMMMWAYAGTGVFLSDGATNVMPVGDTETVHAAWRLAYGHTRHSLETGFYQGWDLHPAQLPVRYAACYAFFLEGFEQAAERLSNFIAKAAQATLVGEVFDDAATGQGLLNYFLRARNCGAITDAELAQTGLSVEEIQLRSFAKILAGRRG